MAVNLERWNWMAVPFRNGNNLYTILSCNIELAAITVRAVLRGACLSGQGLLIAFMFSAKEEELQFAN